MFTMRTRPIPASRRTHPLLVLIATGGSIAATSCTNSDGKPDADSGQGHDSTPTGDTDSNDPGDTDSNDPGPIGTLGGRVVDSSGAPLAGVNAQLCREVCKLARTAEDGSFQMEAAPGRWALEVIVDSADPASGWATPLTLVDIVEDVDRSLPSSVVVPMLDAVVALTAPARVEVGSGLWLDAVPDEWEAPVLTPDAAPWVGGVQVAPAAVGLPLDGIDQQVAAAWYLAPMASHPQQPWAMTFDNSFDWSPGASAEVWIADYGTQTWLNAGLAVVSDDGTELTGAQLSVFGTVLLFAPVAGE